VRATTVGGNVRLGGQGQTKFFPAAASRLASRTGAKADGKTGYRGSGPHPPAAWCAPHATGRDQAGDSGICRLRQFSAWAEWVEFNLREVPSGSQTPKGSSLRQPARWQFLTTMDPPEAGRHSALSGSNSHSTEIISHPPLC
jgi:hypothetical protein